MIQLKTVAARTQCGSYWAATITLLRLSTDIVQTEILFVKVSALPAMLPDMEHFWKCIETRRTRDRPIRLTYTLDVYNQYSSGLS